MTTDMPSLPPALPAENSLGLDEVFRVVARRKWLLLGIMGVALALTYVWSRLVTPLYSAEALVLVEPKDSGIAALQTAARGLSADEATVQSEAYVLSSRALAERVIGRLDLLVDPRFAGDARGGTPAQQLSAAIDEFVDRLEVRPQENSRVIAVRFSAEEPARAAQIVNTLTDEYVLAGIEAKFSATQRAAGWLNTQVGELRGKVEEGEQRVEALRRKFGLVSGSSGTLSGQELAEVNTQLIMARVARAEAQARLSRVRSLARSGGDITTAAEVLGSPLIQRLREQEAELRRRVAELSSELGERHPQMLQLRAEAADLQAKIDSEVGKVIAGLRNEVSVAAARENAIASSLAASQNRVATGNESGIPLRAAEREVEANRTLLASLLARQKEAVAEKDMSSQQSDARVIAAAGPPVEPSFPKTGVMLGLVFLASGILGLLSILVSELLDSGFRSGEQVEQSTGVTALGFIPKATLDQDDSLYGLIRQQPESAFGEALRTLNWSVSLTRPDDPPRIVLVTSARPAEGKTSIASSLALVQALAGRKVMLIDADTRRPTLHEVTGVPRSPGLLEVLSGRAELKDVIRDAGPSGLKVIAAGASTSVTPNLLASARMDTLLADLRSRFDLVVIDSPPVMAAADARILARKADATVVAVRWAGTRREAVLAALRQLQADGTRIAGVVLTLVDARKHAQYSYGDSGAYAGELAKYYVG
ncbi:MAG: polysaccharide biosynthesis tyrosine autokinase [Gammaproteobacteria bacterium]